MTKRLSEGSVSALPPGVLRPAYDRSNLQKRMVHIGVGAFHRAHQAVYTDLVNAGSDMPWGVTGISLRSRTAETQLAPQDMLFTVEATDGANSEIRLIGNLVEIITASEDKDAALRALARPEVAVVTLTITEKGYALDPATGELLQASADIRHDLANPTQPVSAIGFLTESLRLRRLNGDAAFTALSCDNLPSNGKRLRSAVIQFAKLLDPDLADWIDTHAAFPESMVDRIAPAISPQDIEDLSARIGLVDEGHVRTEPFMQWVIQDWFVGERPEWEKAGALVVPDVKPFELAKLRLLNGAHSAIAYVGYLSGCEFVHDVMNDDGLASFVANLMDEEIAPTFDAPDGLDKAAYARELRARFRNASLRHRTWQIAMDGSQKLPQRLLDTARYRLKNGLSFPRIATAIAAWMVYATGETPTGEAIDVRDPLRDRLADAAATAGRNPEKLMDGFLAITEIFGDDLAASTDFRRAVLCALTTILEHGAHHCAHLANTPA